MSVYIHVHRILVYIYTCTLRVHEKLAGPMYRIPTERTHSLQRTAPAKLINVLYLCEMNELRDISCDPNLCLINESLIFKVRPDLFVSIHIYPSDNSLRIYLSDKSYFYFLDFQLVFFFLSFFFSTNVNNLVFFKLFFSVSIIYFYQNQLFKQCIHVVNIDFTNTVYEC